MTGEGLDGGRERSQARASKGIEGGRRWKNGKNLYGRNALS